MEEKLIGVAQYIYSRVEKRALPLEASKALTNSYYRRTTRDISDSMLLRVKDYLNFWIEDSSLVQIYKRFFNYLLKKEERTLGDCFSPFVLVNCSESFEDLILKNKTIKKDAFNFLKGFFGTLRLDNLLILSDREELFRELLRVLPSLGRHRFFIATHIAYMVNPNYYAPITPSVGKFLEVSDIGSYMRFMDYIIAKRIKPIEAFATLYLLSEGSPSKRYTAELLLGIDREKELLIKASEMWNRGNFYEAHEVLEEVWHLQRDTQARECYQGIIRLALVLHYVYEGDREKALRILRKALPQLTNCKCKLSINLHELALFAGELVDKLKSKEKDIPKISFKVV